MESELIARRRQLLSIVVAEKNRLQRTTAKAIHLAAMNAARFNPDLRLVYDRLRAAGKPPKVAFIALARKLLVRLNAMVRDSSVWSSTHA